MANSDFINKFKLVDDRLNEGISNVDTDDLETMALSIESMIEYLQLIQSQVEVEQAERGEGYV